MYIEIKQTEKSNGDLFPNDFINAVNYEVIDTDHNITYEIDVAVLGTNNQYFRSVVNGYHLEQTAIDIETLIDNLTAIEYAKLEQNTPENIAIREFDSLKSEILTNIKNDAEKLILDSYPTYKQLNYIREGGSVLEIMSNFIDSIRIQSNSFEADVNTISDIMILENYSYEYILN